MRTLLANASSSSQLIDTLHIRLFAADFRTLNTATWNTRNVLDTFWRFYMNNRDGAALELLDGIYPLQANRLYFVPAGVRFTCLNSCDVEHFYVHFDVIGLSYLARRELFDHPICLLPSSSLESATQALAQELTMQSMHDLITQCHIKSLIYAAMAHYLASVQPERLEHFGSLATAHEPVLPALQYIEDNLPSPISNQQLAQLCHLSEDYFIRRFRECVGQSPLQYILERRVLLAAQRLLFTDSSIEAIAAATGFGNRFYFSRVFARELGVSPAAYRKASRV